MIRRHQQRGSAVLYAILLSPTLLLCLTLGVQVGQLQLQKARLQSAVDVAVTDAGARASAGGLSAILDEQSANLMTRQALADNLRPLASDIAGVSPEIVADDAEIIAVTQLPAISPFDGSAISRPTLLTRIRVPIRTGLLALAGLPSVETLSVTGSADLRVSAGANSNFQ